MGRRKLVRLGVIVAIGIAVGSVVVGATPVGASGTFDGVLGMKGPGQRYAGTDASGFFNNVIMSRPAVPGGTETFGLEVINTGTATSQYQLELQTAANSPGTGSPSYRLLAGTRDVTALAEQGGSNGYVTAPIAPGAKQVLSLKITTATTSTAISEYFASVTLNAVGDLNTFLDEDFAIVGIKSSTGTTDHDIFATSGGQPTTTGMDINGGAQGFMTAPTMALGGSSTYTVTLRNDGSAASVITFHLAAGDCSSSWTTTAKVGTHDITAAALSGTYQTPSLAPGKAVKVTVTVSSHAPLPADVGCADFRLMGADATTVNGENQIILINNVVR